MPTASQLRNLLTDDEQRAVLKMLDRTDLRRDIDRMSVDVMDAVRQFVAEHVDAFVGADMLPGHEELTIALVVGWILGFGSISDALDRDAQMRAVTRNSLIATLAAGWSMENTHRARKREVN